MFLPETNTSHDILYSLDLNAKIVTPEGKWKWKRDGNESKWRSLCKYEEGWIDCASAPKINLHIAFNYHPMPPPGPPPQAHVSTPEKEKRLLTPLRVPPLVKQQSVTTPTVTLEVPSNFDPNSLEADKVVVKLDIARASLYLYGTLIRSFMHMKENVFGEDQQFTPMDVQYGSTTRIAMHDNESCLSEAPEEWDERIYRPIEVVLDISVSNLQAHLLKNCSLHDDPCPFAMVEDISFEMDKKYRETRLQLILSPVVLRSGSLSSK